LINPLDLEITMRVLVAGDRGYIGAVLVPFLRASGHEVVGLDIGWYDGCDFGAQPNGYEQRTGDIRDVTPEDVEGFDAVIHLAAISNDPIGHLNPEATYAVNAHGAIHMAEASKAAGVPRFLFSSSCSLYGAAGEKPVDETAQFNPVTPYGESKMIAEHGLAELADDAAYGCSRTAVRGGRSCMWRTFPEHSSPCSRRPAR
jgi:nucleoside-diphosphate-sugar epimerase